MNKLEINCIIQARMGSERLPGKVLLDLIDGKKSIEFLIEQLETILWTLLSMIFELNIWPLNNIY